jgi:hypothetical protein
MRFLTIFVISLMIGACSAHTSKTTMAVCANDGSGGDGCVNNQASLKVDPLFDSRRRQGKTCGDRIKAEEVLVIDMESPGGKASLEKAGPYVLLTESLLGLENKGSKVKSMKAAADAAASRGCDLLLTGPLASDSWRTNSMGVAPNGNPNGNYDSPVKVKKYLLVRMAKLQKEQEG